MRSVRDIAVQMQAVSAELSLDKPALLGLGFGGWVAAEMATMAPKGLSHLVVVGPFGIKPKEGYVLDQAIISYIDYPQAFFHDQNAFTDALRRRDNRSARSLGHRPRDVLPHGVEALHVQPDAAASAGLGESAFADRVGRARQGRAGVDREPMEDGAAQCQARDHQGCGACRRHGEARRARQARRRVPEMNLKTRSISR